VAIAAIFATGCGGGSTSGGTIPADQASTLNQSLDDLQQALAARNCSSAQSAAVRFAAAVNDTSADATVKGQLSQGAAQVSRLVTQDLCTPSGTTETTSTSTTEPSAPVTPTTEPTTTTSTKPPPKEPAAPKPGPSAPSLPETSPPSPGSSSNGPPGPSGNPNQTPITGGTESGGVGAGGGD
jgi:hypothetical protein